MVKRNAVFPSFENDLHLSRHSLSPTSCYSLPGIRMSMRVHCFDFFFSIKKKRHASCMTQCNLQFCRWFFFEVTKNQGEKWQEDLSKLCECAKKWELGIHVAKSRVFGRKDLYLEDDGLWTPIYKTGKASWETLWAAPKRHQLSVLPSHHKATRLECHEEKNGRHRYPAWSAYSFLQSQGIARDGWQRQWSTLRLAMVKEIYKEEKKAVDLQSVKLKKKGYEEANSVMKRLNGGGDL